MPGVSGLNPPYPRSVAHIRTKGLNTAATSPTLSMKSSARTCSSVNLPQRVGVSFAASLLQMTTPNRAAQRQQRTHLCTTATLLSLSKSISLCSLSTPFGATFKASSCPKTFCLLPLRWGLGGPNSLTKSGWEIVSRNRVGSVRICRRIEATSFFPGNQIPEARMELPLGEMAR